MGAELERRVIWVACVDAVDLINIIIIMMMPKIMMMPNTMMMMQKIIMMMPKASSIKSLPKSDHYNDDTRR